MRRQCAVNLDRNLKRKLAIMRQFTSVTDRHTDRQTDTDIVAKAQDVCITSRAKNCIQNTRNLTILSSKIQKFSGEVAQLPPQTPSPLERGTPPPQTSGVSTLTPLALATRLLAICPPPCKKSWRRPCHQTHCTFRSRGGGMIPGPWGERRPCEHVFLLSLSGGSIRTLTYDQAWMNAHILMYWQHACRNVR